MLELHKPWHQGKDFENKKEENWESEREREREKRSPFHSLSTSFPNLLPLPSLSITLQSLFCANIPFPFSLFLPHPTLQLAPFSCVCQYHPQIMDNNIFDAASGVNCSICENGDSTSIKFNSSKMWKTTNIDHQKTNMTKKTEIKNDDEHRKHLYINDKKLITKKLTNEIFGKFDNSHRSSFITLEDVVDPLLDALEFMPQQVVNWPLLLLPWSSSKDKSTQVFVVPLLPWTNTIQWHLLPMEHLETILPSLIRCFHSLVS